MDQGSRRSAGDRGVILYTVMVMLVIVLGVTGVLMTLAVDDRLIASLDSQMPIALAAAEGATQQGVKTVLRAVTNYRPIPVSGSATINGQTYYWTVSSAGPSSSRSDSLLVATNYQHYYVTSVVNLDHARVKVNRLIQVGKTPIFQFGVFFNDDLEIKPGAGMTLTGRIHTNGNLTVGSSGAITFNTNYVRAALSVYRTAGSSGAVSVYLNGSGSPGSFKPWPTSLDSANDPTFARDVQTAFNGSVQSGATGVTELVAPSIRAISPTGYYATNAGLTIKDNLAYASGSSVPLVLPVGTVVEKTMYDARQGGNIKVTEVDIGLLTPSLPANGLIYAYRSDTSTGTSANGIRLKNGATLPTGGLTVVTPDPIYVQGNFNTVNKKPAAVLADALNLLSNAWNDSKVAGTLPSATPTTYNLGFVAGHVNTAGSNYSGGLENFPRFHESWSGVSCTFAGSMANFWQSQYATAIWPGTGGDKYNAPTRVWSYDGTPANAPFAPVTAGVIQCVLTVDR